MIKVESFGLSNISRYVSIVLIDENRENGKNYAESENPMKQKL